MFFSGSQELDDASYQAHFTKYMRRSPLTLMPTMVSTANTPGGNETGNGAASLRGDGAVLVFFRFGRGGAAAILATRWVDAGILPLP